MSIPLSPHESRPEFRVAICGAGIAGLILAITIGKYNTSIPIDIYEAHHSINTEGAGIVLSKQTREVMIELGLFDDFRQIFTHQPGSDIVGVVRRSDIPGGGYEWYRRVPRYTPSTMHRKQMIAVLEKRLPASCEIHFKKWLVDYREPEQEDPCSNIRLEFADRTTAVADVLIGADGIRSATRQILFEAASANGNDSDRTDFKQYIEATFTGITVYRCLIPAETLRKEDPEYFSFDQITVYVGKGRHFIAYPIAKSTLINVVVFISDPSLTGTYYEGHWTSDATRDELVAHFSGFEPDARKIIKLCENPSKWALHVVKPLPFCVRKRVALVGDACHAMTPHLTAGAVQAIDDAFVLGRLIAHPLTTLSRIPDVLRIYEGVRLPIAHDVASNSLSAGWMQQFMEPGYYNGTRKEEDLDDRGISRYEKEEMETLRQEILGLWDWVDELSSAPQTWKEVVEPKLIAHDAY